jgi:hypothetical protein
MNRIQAEACCTSCCSDIKCKKCGSTTFCGCVAPNVHCTDRNCRCHGSGRSSSTFSWK